MFEASVISWHGQAQSLWLSIICPAVRQRHQSCHLERRAFACVKFFVDHPTERFCSRARLSGGITLII
jgi:hypothetical protein